MTPTNRTPPPEDPPSLVGYMEIAMRAGVRRSTVTDWRNRHPDFPRPLVELHVGPVFWWPDVRRWLHRTGRRWDANLGLDEVRQKFPAEQVKQFSADMRRLRTDTSE
jgi:hypothetical protein